MAVKSFCFISVTICLTLLTRRECFAQENELVSVQIWHRHGARLPGDPIDPNTAPLWAEFGYPGGFTRFGLAQMQNLGKFLRRHYIEEEALLPPTLIDDRLIYARGSSTNVRAHRSSMNVAETLYPGEGLPVFFAEREELLLPSNYCPSYQLEYPRIANIVEEQYLQNYGDLLGNISERTGWAAAGYDFPPLQLLQLASENIEFQVDHRLPVDPYLLENFDLLTGLYANAYYQQYTNMDVNDQRGPISFSIGREVINNFRAVSNGETPVRMFLYGAQWVSMVSLWLSLGHIDPFFNPRVGLTFVFEVRRRGDGLLTVEGFKAEIAADGVNYNELERFPLNCPTSMDVCLLNDWLTYLENRHPIPSSTEGCCFKGQGFSDLGCDDYLNPDSANVPQCAQFREMCPEFACDIGQVVAWDGLECVERNKEMRRKMKLMKG